MHITFLNLIPNYLLINLICLNIAYFRSLKKWITSFYHFELILKKKHVQQNIEICKLLDWNWSERPLRLINSSSISNESLNPVSNKYFITLFKTFSNVFWSKRSSTFLHEFTHNLICKFFSDWSILKINFPQTSFLVYNAFYDFVKIYKLVGKSKNICIMV